MSQTTLPPAQMPRRWPLYASLFLNVVLITVLAFGAWHIHEARGGREPRDSFRDYAVSGWLPRQVERVLPAESATKVRAIREAHAAKIVPLFKASRDARDAVRHALGAEPFDTAALKAALLSMREADGAIATATAEMIVEIASTLSPAERQLVREKARELRKRPPGRERDGRGRGREMRGEGPPPPGDLPPPDEMPPPPEGPDGPPPPTP